MAKDIKLIHIIIYAIQGAIVGAGAILPGVSGGVLCVAFGLYEPVIELLTNPKKAIKENYKMFAPFLTGWALGFLLLAGILDALFSFAPDVALFLFFGLVCGTVPEMIKKSELSDKNASWTPFVISMGVSYILFHIIDILKQSSVLVVPANVASYVFCGCLWGLSLIVPGLSSSSVLECLGLYEPLMEGIANFNFAVLLPFVIGIAATALAFARLVNMLFKKHYAPVSRIILGFVLSSSLKTLPYEFKSGWSMVISMICCAVGFLIAWAMEKHEKKEAR